MKIDSEINIWGREDIIVKEYRKRDPDSDGTDSFIGYKKSDFEKARNRVIEAPDKNQLFLDLDIYIFDRIENDEEKEKRREEIFEYIQYLKEEKLFEHLEMRVVFVDERVLADSYNKCAREIYFSDKVEKYIEEEDTTVYLPPEDLRKEMSKELQKEIDEMSEKELLANMENIRKEDLSYDGIRKWNSQYQSLVYSEGMIKERYTSSYDPDTARDYNDINNVRIGTNLEYVYK